MTAASQPDCLYSLTDVRLSGVNCSRLAVDRLQIPHGITAVLGYSGAGKTSLLNLLTGYEHPDGGQVIRHDSPGSSFRLPLFWSPQNGGLWPHLTVEQHLSVVQPAAVGAGDRGTDCEIIPQRTSSPGELLRLFDLSDRREAVPGELSQGERSRLAVARAIASSAEVLILDEPLAHVDLARKFGYWGGILQQSTAAGTSIIFASHEPEVVLRAAETVICLDAGRVIFQGRTKELFQHPPTARTARMLGPVNWFDDAAEYGQWLEVDGDSDGNRHAVRPSELVMRCDPSSPLELVSSMEFGTYCETEVRHQSIGVTRPIVHRSVVDLPCAGSGVRFHVERI